MFNTTQSNTFCKLVLSQCHQAMNSRGSIDEQSESKDEVQQGQAILRSISSIYLSEDRQEVRNIILPIVYNRQFCPTIRGYWLINGFVYCLCFL